MSFAVRAVLAAVVLVAIVAGGAYAYFFSGLRQSPAPLASVSAPPSPPSPSPAPSPTGPASQPAAGTWTVGAGSQAEYRVKEQFAGEPSQHEAVARTSEVRGSFAVTSGGAGLHATGLSFQAGLSTLASVDTVAGRNVVQRDGIVKRVLEVANYPTATFSAPDLDLPAGAAQGTAFPVPGSLTIHGVTKPVTIQVQVQVADRTLRITGSTQVDMRDFNVAPPSLSFTTVYPATTLDFALVAQPG